MRKYCALIGERLGHSYSAAIHRFWNRYDYELRPMPAEQVPIFLQSRAFDGLNVTIPYKQLVMPYCDDISPQATAIGSVNVIVKGEDGRLHGYNTDYFGLEGLARRTGIDFQGRKVVVFGNGGTTKTVLAVAKANGAREIVVVSRKGPVTYDRTELFHDGEILVNATPVGMYPNTDCLIVDPADFPKCEGILDVIYNPSRTRLLQRAAALGLPCANGLWMLAEQARVTGELFSGEPLDAEWTDRVVAELNRQLLNWVIVGMPGCGKSTVGAALGKRLPDHAVVDIDDCIVKRAGKPISEIFAQDGEEAFRQLESDIIAEESRQTGRILITGGGAVLREENRLNLRQNGRVFWLRRPLEQLDVGHGRPLSPNREATARLATQREPLYAATADAVIQNIGTVEQTVDAMMAKWDACLSI
jgi:shikimate dehydrogenase